MRPVIIVLTFLLCAGCNDKKPDSANSDAFLEGRAISELKEKQLGEVSGLAASALHPGLLWAHNDSGNPAVVYLIDLKLAIRLACTLQGARNRDWEDIAVGPGPEPGKKYVYVADIGDNHERYATKYIYRFEEPRLTDGLRSLNITSFDTIAFRLEDGAKDAEAMFVHPKTKDIYIFSKWEKPVGVYLLKYPFSEGVSVAKLITTLPLTLIVAADISPDGQEVLLKNYDNVYYWNLNGRTLAKAFEEKPAVLKYTLEPQGEAITFDVGGNGFYTLSEKVGGEKVYLYFYQRTDGDW